MKKKMISLFIILFSILAVVIITRNPKVANQIIISTEDIYDNISGKNEEITDVKGININELEIKNSSYYYEKLTDEQKKIYKAVAVAIKNLDSNAKIKEYNFTDDNTTMKDVKAAILNLFLDHPEVFYVSNDYTVSTIELLNSKRIEIDLKYLVKDKNDLNKKITEIKNVIDPIINDAKNMDKFDAELYIHDKICEMCTYYKYSNIEAVPEECHTIYGCLVNKQAVCDGLSKSLQIMLDKVEIDNILVTGNLQNQAHAWIMVKLDDNWYHMDITSNKSVRNESGKEEIIHSYFNITSERIKKTNSIDIEEQLPEASATEYNYYLKTDKYISLTDNFSYKLKNILKNNQNSRLAEFAADPRLSTVPEKMSYVLQDSNYSEYVNKALNRFNYYNVLNSYIILKNN